MLKLSPEDRKQLLSLLENLPDMATERSRQYLLQDAGLDRISVRINLSCSCAEAVRAIVSTLATYGFIDSDRTALGLLLAVVRERVGLGQQKFLDRLLASQFPHQQLAEILQPELEEIAEVVAAAYQDCRPQHDTDRSPPATLQDKLTKLKDFPDNTHLNCSLLERFAAFFKREELSDRAWHLLTEWLQSRGIDAEDLRSRVGRQRQDLEATSSRAGKFYFLVVVEPHKQMQDRYYLKGWAAKKYDRHSKQGYRAKTGTGSKNLQIEEPVKAEEICDRLPALLREGEVPNDAILAFFLPDKLVGKGIEFLKIKRDETPIWLSEYYQVCIRSYERLTKTYSGLRQEWQQKWENLIDPKVATSAGQVFVEGETSSPLRARRKSRKALGLKLSEALHEPEKQQTLLTTLRSNAIPAAVWLRRAPASDAQKKCCDEIARLLSCHCSCLFENVHQKREEVLDLAAEQEEEYDLDNPEKCHLTGRHISFLWDDPYLIPPLYYPESS